MREHRETNVYDWRGHILTQTDNRRPERMPIKLDGGGDEPPRVEPGTNAHEVLEALLDHPDMAFAPRELVDLTDVRASSIHKTLARLRERGLVRKVHGSYWAVENDVAASRVANVVSLSAIREQYGEDEYAENDDWARGQPDLGENA